jgi:Secretion system C-terminal sorting domain
VDEFALEHLIVYPNPARDAFTITTSSVSTAMVHVVNMMGEVVYATSTNGQNKIEIPAQLWSAGIYQVQWIQGNQQWVKSIVIEK